MDVTIKNARLAFSAIFTSKDYEGDGNFRFTASFIIDPADKVQVKKIEDAILSVAKDKWGSQAENKIKSLSTKDMLCLHDGSEKAEKYEGFEGMLYLSSGSKRRPSVFDRDGKTPLVEEDGHPYAGCIVNARVSIYVQKDGKRINAGLMGVQFAKDGEAFGGGRAASADEFEELETSE